MKIRSTLALLAILGFTVPALVGCDDTLEKKDTKTVQSDGTVTHDKKEVKEKSDGTIVKEEKHTVDK